MNNVKKGDIVVRKSHNKDIVFIIDRIVNNEIAILTGVTTRLKADSYLNDLEVLKKQEIKNINRKINENILNKVNQLERKNKELLKRSLETVYTGKILHLDGDKRYSEKSKLYYQKMGLNAIVRNIIESRQPSVVDDLLSKYRPDILVITGHDGMIKLGKSYEDIYNYRNSIYFAQTVKNARKNNNKDLVIFAGACQSYYEALISAGANFASSPARILIDFMDPLVVASKIALTNYNKFLTIDDIEDELRDGERGINGVGANGKKKILVK